MFTLFLYYYYTILMLLLYYYSKSKYCFVRHLENRKKYCSILLYQKCFKVLDNNYYKAML